ncbi:MAG: VOC family protein [Myxococcota bacterium]|nr:VOC family protein [Myxococcales bacterium]
MTFQYVMHVGVCVRDLERSLRFYRDGLGFAEVGVGRLEIEGEPTATMLGLPDLELHAIYLERDGVRIELLHYPRPGTVGPAEARPMNQPGLTHFAMRVTDLDEAIERIRDFGGHLVEGSRVHNPVYAAHLTYVTDPDGTRIELIETPKDPTR